MRKKSNTLTERELDIMKIIWELESATVRQTYETMRERDDQVAYTTVMTMLGILEEKGHLTKTRSGRAFVYAPVRPQGEVISGMVSEFVDRVFNGSAQPLVLSLLRDRHLSEEELEELARKLPAGPDDREPSKKGKRKP